MEADRAVGKEAGWSKVFHIVVDRGVWAQLSWKAKAVYIVLHRHVDDVTRICWPGIGLIALEAGIHVRNVSAALAELERWRLIKRWRKDRKNFYHLYRADKLKDLLPQKMDISNSPQKVDVRPLRKRRNVLGRFMPASPVEEPAPSSVDHSPPSAMETVAPPPVEPKESSLRRVPEEDPNKKKQGGEDEEELIPGRLTRRAFTTNQRRLNAWDRPNKEMDFWMRNCIHTTEEEMQGVYTREYPGWKQAQGNGAG